MIPDPRVVEVARRIKVEQGGRPATLAQVAEVTGFPVWVVKVHLEALPPGALMVGAA